MAEVTGMTPGKITQEINNVKSYVDGGLSEKADKSHIDNATTNIGLSDPFYANKLVKLNFEGKLFIATASIINQGDPTNKAYVDNGLSKKADKIQVTSDLSKKADITQVASDLSKKADITQVASDLSKKADITQVTSELSKKADITYVDSLTPLKSFAGTGSPEGKITAPIGSIYTDSAATTGAIRWIKTSGTGSNGWVVEYGDTGWRDVTDLLEPEKLSKETNGYLHIRRTERYIEYAIKGMTVLNTGNLYSSTNGFRVDDTQVANVFNGSGFFLASRFVIGLFGVPVGYNFSVDRKFIIRFTARPNEWPTTLPGTPA